MGSSINDQLRLINPVLVQLILFVLLQAQEISRVEVGERWHLECPRLGYRPSPDRLSVTWTQNNVIWLKIEKGNASVAQQLTSLQISRIGASRIIHIASNNFRYRFNYDEMMGTYEFTIMHAEPEDTGQWICYVTVEHSQQGTTEELTNDGFLIVGKDTELIPGLVETDANSDDDGWVPPSHVQEPTNGGNVEIIDETNTEAISETEIGPMKNWNITGNGTAKAISPHSTASILTATSLLMVNAQRGN